MRALGANCLLSIATLRRSAPLVVCSLHYYNRGIVANFLSSTNRYDEFNSHERLRPVPHKLVSSGNGERRGWYGRMYFPPKNVVDYNKIANSNDSDEVLPGCVTMKSSKLGVFENGNIVDTTYSCTVPDGGGEGIYCWTQCMPLSDVSCGYGLSAVCWDTVTNVEVDGTDHCPETDNSDCSLKCVTNAPAPDNGNGFCKGAGTTMFMDGMHFVLGGDVLCLNLYFTQLTMNSSTTFVLGCLFIISLGIGVEAIGAYTKKLFKEDKKRGKGVYVGKLWIKNRTIVFSLLRFTQTFAGYVLMLATMTYVPSERAIQTSRRVA